MMTYEDFNSFLLFISILINNKLKTFAASGVFKIIKAGPLVHRFPFLLHKFCSISLSCMALKYYALLHSLIK